jgi:hypothetical protein
MTVAREFGAPAEIAGVLCSQASLALEQLRLDEARELAGRSLDLSALPHPMRLHSPDWVRGVVYLRQGDLDAAARDFTEGLTFHGGPAGPRPIANARFGLACVEAARGRTGAAVAGHVSALRLRSAIDDRLGVADSLLGLADTVLRAEPTGAARLVGASVALRSVGGAVPTPRQQSDVDSTTRTAVDLVGAAAAETARTEGAALTEAQAVAFAFDLCRRFGAQVPVGTTRTT